VLVPVRNRCTVSPSEREIAQHLRECGLRQRNDPARSRENWVLVTSAYHMPRAVASFEGGGWSVIPYLVDFKIGPRTGLSENFKLLDSLSAITPAGKEWVGLVGYRLM